MENLQRKQIGYIYRHMGDEYSRQMYGYRLLYSLTGSTKWIEKVIQMTEEGERFIKKLENAGSKEKIIFGTGSWGRGVLKSFPNIQWDFFVDNYVKGNEVVCEIDGGGGYRVLSFDDLVKNHQNSIIVIATRLYHREILKQLLEHGFSDENIINMGKMIDEMSERQYFDLPYMKHCDHEVFADVGCFDGTTSMFFAKWSGNVYDAIYAFEPDYHNYEKCKRKLADMLGSGEIFPYGLWNMETTLLFNAISTGASAVSSDGTIKIQVKVLDEVLRDKNVTFIKMDVEGSELNALKGAKKMIVEKKPKLAISIYHKPEDMWEIPELLLEYNPEYTFYLRHYSVAADETVLYAV